MLPNSPTTGSSTTPWCTGHGRRIGRAPGAGPEFAQTADLTRRDRKVQAALIAAGFSCPAGRTRLRLDRGYWFANLRVGDRIVIITGEDPATDERTLAQLRLRYGIVAVRITPAVLREARRDPGSLSHLIQTAMDEQAELQAARAAQRITRRTRRASARADGEPALLARTAEAAIGRLPGLTSSRLSAA